MNLAAKKTREELEMEWWRLGVRYLTDAKAAEVRYREQKELFDAYKDAYTERFAAAGRDNPVDLVNAAHKASGDQRRQDAAKAAAWHRDEANMYANLAQVCFAAVARIEL